MEKEKVAKTKKTKTESAKSAFSIEVFDLNGKVVGTAELPKEIFGVTPNKTLMTQAIRIYLANQRLGNAKTLSRGEVQGGGKKPWKQKGTGRARIGSIRAPHWRGGGVVHGPVPKDYSLEMPKKMKRKALLSALTSKYKDKEVLVLKDLNFKEEKTKEGAKFLKALELNGRILIVTDSVGQKEKLVLRNLPKVDLTSAKELNTYRVFNNKKVLFTKSAVEALPEIFVKN